MTGLTQPRQRARALLHAIAVAGVMSAGVAVAPLAAKALEPQTIVFSNPRVIVDTGEIIGFSVQVIEGSTDTTIIITAVGGCQMINATQAEITDATRECNVTAHSLADETYEEAYAYLTMNPRRVDQEALTGDLSGSGVYGANIGSVVSGGSTSYDITYQYNANCEIGEDLGGGTARHRVIGGQGDCVIIATRPGDDDYRAVSTVMTLAVSPALLDVDAGDVAKIAGDDDPVLPWALSGFVNGDTSTVVSGVADCDRAAGEAPGSYDIACGPNSLSADDYTFASGSPGSLTITVRDAPTVTATATAGTATTIDTLEPFGGGFALASFDTRSANGATIALSAGAFTYTAPTSFAGTDRFAYTVVDQFGNETVVTVTIQVAAAAPDPTTTLVPTTTTALIAPTAESAPEAAPVVTPTDGVLPSTGFDARAVLAVAAVMVFAGFSLRRARRT